MYYPTRGARCGIPSHRLLVRGTPRGHSKQYRQLPLLSVVHQNLMVDPTAENATRWSQNMQKSSPYWPENLFPQANSPSRRRLQSLSAILVSSPYRASPLPNIHAHAPSRSSISPTPFPLTSMFSTNPTTAPSRAHSSCPVVELGLFVCTFVSL